MKVTQVSIQPTAASKASDRPALTPELLAASGARYSRNNQGLSDILSKIDHDDLDKSVDSIFRMVDYGHQSIADMAPVAIFIDGISILLAYLVWTWCPTAGGQESSTRYIRLDREGLVDPELLGVNAAERGEWYSFMDKCFDAYSASLLFWTQLGRDRPELARIPDSLLRDSSERNQKRVLRMRRNFAFDRARYFLPVAAKTNIMLVMSARGWVQLCQNLLSHWLPEASLLGAQVRAELALTVPRMVKHAQPRCSFRAGHQAELERLINRAKVEGRVDGEAACVAAIELFPPSDVSEQELLGALKWYDNRYAFIDFAACRTSVRFSWTAVAMAEVRDLNRHRTGQKYCPLLPVGFYFAADQVPTDASFDLSISTVGILATDKVKNYLAAGNSGYGGWLVLGSQFYFEHTTTLDKFIYEAALRTGPGAHFRYADHLRQAVSRLRGKYTKLSRAIPLGMGEPE